MSPHIQQYIAEIRIGRSKKTVKDLTYHLTEFGKWMDANGFAALTRETLAQYIVSNHEKIGKASLHYRENHIRTFFKWLYSNRYSEIDWSDSKKITGHYVSPMRTEEFAVTQEQYKALLAAARKEEFKTLLCIAWNTGLRMGDCAMMRWDQISLASKNPMMTIAPRKMRRYAQRLEIPLMPELLTRVRGLETSKTKHPDLLIPKLAASYEKHGNCVISKMFSTVRKKAKLEKISFHSLRHGFVTRALANGVPVGILSQLTGQRIEMIQQYLHTSIEDKRRELIRALGKPSSEPKSKKK